MAAKKATSAKSEKSNGNGANLGFEAKLWLAADNRQDRRWRDGRHRARYPPELQEEATRTVLEQAKLMCADWAGQGRRQSRRGAERAEGVRAGR